MLTLTIVPYALASKGKILSSVLLSTHFLEVYRGGNSTQISRFFGSMDRGNMTRCIPTFKRISFWDVEFHGFGTVPKLGEPQYRPQYIIVLIMGAPKKVPLILGNPHLGLRVFTCRASKHQAGSPSQIGMNPQSGATKTAVCVRWAQDAFHVWGELHACRNDS